MTVVVVLLIVLQFLMAGVFGFFAFVNHRDKAHFEVVVTAVLSACWFLLGVWGVVLLASGGPT